MTELDYESTSEDNTSCEENKEKIKLKKNKIFLNKNKSNTINNATINTNINKFQNVKISNQNLLLLRKR